VKILAIVLAMLGAVGPAMAGEVVIPVVAWDAHGVGSNRWSTELYLSNTAPQQALVTVAVVLPLRVVQQVPCLPPVAPFVVPGFSTRVVTAAELNRYLGCPGQFVGGLVLEAPAGVVVATRMTNHKALGEVPEEELLQGLSQEIPGLPTATLPQPGEEYMLPALGWHPQPCTGRAQLDTYLYLANPGMAMATVTLFDPSGRIQRLSLNRQVVTLPYELTVPGERLAQFLVAPAPEVMTAVCGKPAIFDLFFRPDQPVAALASVVDRSTQDARTVLPAALSK
jgi:hypothetical protein